MKLKEVSYIHAEGYPAGEMKHGPIALIDENMPVVVIAPRDGLYDKMRGNVEEVKARGGRIIALVSEGDEDIAALADEVIEIPQTPELLTPIVSAVPLQMLAYHVAVPTSPQRRLPPARVAGRPIARHDVTTHPSLEQLMTAPHAGLVEPKKRTVSRKGGQPIFIRWRVEAPLREIVHSMTTTSRNGKSPNAGTGSRSR